MRELRRMDRKMSGVDAYKLFTSSEYGILATEDENHQLYATPLNYVVSGSILYFHSADDGQKLDNIKFNNRVCFTVVGKTKVIPDKLTTLYESVMAFGKAQVVMGNEKKTALGLLLEKYSNGFEGMNEYIDKAIDKTTIVKIHIDKIVGKENK